MPFIPHSPNEIEQILASLNVKKCEDLFDEIPQDVRCAPLTGIPETINEAQLGRIMHQRAAQDEVKLNFIGAGCYQHHIPAAVWSLASRGEFMTAYTPYQAEASQGGLQLMYEYQTMMASLMGMDVSNASLYDGATALAEAILMALRGNKKVKSKQVFILGAIAPHYLQTVRTITQHQAIEIQQIEAQDLPTQDVSAVVIAQPNFLGALQQVNQLTDQVHRCGGLVIGLVNPIAMAWLAPPGEWGQNGADIACGEGQPLGVPMSNGGPFFGFMTCKRQFVRQLPGRIAGKTIDADGKVAYALTLQAREQHIRRGKATSNICTNQGLLVTAATIYMALMGPEGLKRTALACHHNAVLLKQKLKQLEQITCMTDALYFHEFVIHLPNAQTVQKQLADQGIQMGYALEAAFPDMQDCMLICTTELHTEADFDVLVKAIQSCYSTPQGASQHNANGIVGETLC